MSNSILSQIIAFFMSIFIAIGNFFGIDVQQPETDHIHNYEFKEITKEPTCTSLGVQIFACSCGDEIVDYIDVLNHEIQLIDAIAATCTETGLTTGVYCSVCNTVLKAQEEIPVLGHTPVTDKAMAATCTESGKTEGTHCSVCSTVLKAQEEVPATGHTAVIDKGTVATCTKGGITEGSHCSVCNAVIKAQETIPANGHIAVIDKGTAATCTEAGKTDGSHCSVCYITLVPQTEIPAKGHTVVTDRAVAATCIAEGKTEGSHCSVCNAVIKAQEIVPVTGHTVVTDDAVATCTKTGLTEGSHCSVCNVVLKAQEEIPAFNTIVNELKSTENNYFTGIFEDISHCEKPVVSGMLAGMMEGEDMVESTEVTYLPLYENRLITKENFHSRKTDYVSDLSDSDVKSIKIEKVSGVGFVGSLPDKFTSDKTEYDLTDIKGREYPELYKVTIVLPEQKVDITKPVTGTSVYDKIYTKDYNETLEDTRKEISDSFDQLEKEFSGIDGAAMKMNTTGTIEASLTVEYYITTDTFTPVAAKYSHRYDIQYVIKITAAGTNYLTMDQKMDMTSNSYYFFNNDFSAE